MILCVWVWVWVLSSHLQGYAPYCPALNPRAGQGAGASGGGEEEEGVNGMVMSFVEVPLSAEVVAVRKGLDIARGKFRELLAQGEVDYGVLAANM